MALTLQKRSPCKINLLLNILGRRADGFHELETVMQPVNFCDELAFVRAGCDLELTCSDPSLPVDSRNLVWRAAAAFRLAAGVTDGVRIHLEKRIPQAAGLGGGSGNAATTLLGLNELFGHPLAAEKLPALAAELGSDIPFFLQPQPALASGRGEKITPLDAFPALRGAAVVLIHPGFGISTAWTYQNLARFPAALNGRPGRAQKLIALLQQDGLAAAGAELFNSLEAPALEKYPLLALFQEFLRENGAPATLMSGSGSSTFALTAGAADGAVLLEKFKQKFGTTHWTVVVPV
jgi:4-diphosphocytidyl-2-C-methyl-D-erythritol kinase